MQNWRSFVVSDVCHTSSQLRHLSHDATATCHVRLYDEHVIYVLSAARINWRFPYLLLGMKRRGRGRGEDDLRATDQMGRTMKNLRKPFFCA